MDILFQDESIIAVNKPSGLLTIRDGYDSTLPTVKTLLEDEFGRLWIVHRLDKETSGVLIVARNEEAHRTLNLAFENRQVQKKYHAIIYGVPPDSEFVITFPLKVDGDRKHRTVVDLENGKSATSTIKVIERFTNHTLVEIKPVTGYTHQIRAHLSYFGYPILGDKLYQKPASAQNDLIDRTALHAYQITFIHPVTNTLLTIHAEYSEDFQIALSILRK